MNFSQTHTENAPWTIVKSDDKEASRINAIKYLLSQFDYPDKIADKYLKIDTDLVFSGKEKVKMLAKEIDESKSLFD